MTMTAVSTVRLLLAVALLCGGCAGWYSRWRGYRSYRYRNTRLYRTRHPHSHSKPSALKDLAKLDDGSYLAFRVQPAITTPSYDRFLDVGNNDDDNDLVSELLPCGCKTTDGRLPCDRHFRSRLLDLWTSLPVTTVRVGVYKDNVEQRFFLFDATGSTFTDWFAQSRLIDSSYTDLDAATPNFFSIEGDNTVQRRFFINNNYGGCPNDVGWLSVGEGARPCSWEDVVPTTPTIFFSTLNTSTNWNDAANVGFADALVISVTLNTDDTCDHH